MATMEWAADCMADLLPRRQEEAETRRHGFFYDGVEAGPEVRASLSRRSAATRPLPLEDLCFFVKPVDNSRLVRVVDPHSRKECLGLVLAAAFLFALALGYVAPYLLIIRTGYRIEDLKKQYEVLVESNRQLQVKEAALKDPQRIYGIARGKLGLDTPSGDRVVWTDPGRNHSYDGDLIARNSPPTRNGEK
ncbi:MAG: hypothetical protein HY236_09920 [Acidobacteria bacterium]|nr:hypothetical protein [Acidobacteriota bacterium]